VPGNWVRMVLWCRRIPQRE